MDLVNPNSHWFAFMLMAIISFWFKISQFPYFVNYYFEIFSFFCSYWLFSGGIVQNRWNPYIQSAKLMPIRAVYIKFHRFESQNQMKRWNKKWNQTKLSRQPKRHTFPPANFHRFHGISRPKRWTTNKKDLHVLAQTLSKHEKSNKRTTSYISSHLKLREWNGICAAHYAWLLNHANSVYFGFFAEIMQDLSKRYIFTTKHFV